MKHLKTEFRIVTVVFAIYVLISLFMIFSRALYFGNGLSSGFMLKIGFKLYDWSIYYTALLLFIFYISEQFFKKNVQQALAYCALLLGSVALMLVGKHYIFNTPLYTTWGNFLAEKLFKSTLLVLFFSAYTAIKMSVNKPADESASQQPDSLGKKTLKDILIWIGVAILLALVIFFTQESPIATFVAFLEMFWIVIVSYGYIIYTINLRWLIPGYEKKGHKKIPYVLKLMATCLVTAMPYFIVFISMTSSFSSDRSGTPIHRQFGGAGDFSGAEMLILIFLILWLLESTVVTFAAWSTHNRNKKQLNQVLSLKKELGKSSADLQFLRSQINPHFLFNALNTLYGTSLQENSERTAQGIQKLGDMMRFMLHENLKDKIELAKEINYLRQYVDLQMLRIQSSPNIQIETQINEVNCEHHISPMLLIPFAENAFKHGISLKERSWIRIILHCDQQKVYLHVANSIHTRSEADPEMHQSGVGLENVKQRLELLYPGKHELVIHKTDIEYTVLLNVTCV